MKQSIKVSINTVSFNIDDEAYKVLDNYLTTIKEHFAQTTDSKEIISDIELRIAELLQMRLNTTESVVSQEDVAAIINIMGNPIDFAEAEQDEASEGGSFKERISDKPKKKLYRDTDDKTIAGVCGGLSHYFKVDAAILRILLILLFLLESIICYPEYAMVVVGVYLILWVAMPKARTFEQKVNMTGSAISIADISDRSTNQSREYKGSAIKEFLKLIFRAILVAIGTIAVLFLTCLLVFFVWTGIETSIFDVQSYFDFVAINAFSFKLAAGLFIALPILGLINLIIKLYKSSPFKTQNFILLLIGFIIWISSGTYIASKTAPWIYKSQYSNDVNEVVEINTSSDILYVQLGELYNQSTLLPNNSYMLYRDSGDVRDISLLPQQIIFVEVDSTLQDQKFEVKFRTNVRAENWGKVKYEANLTKADYSVSDSLVTINPAWYNKHKPWDLKTSTIYITVPHGKEVKLLGYLDDIGSYWRRHYKNEDEEVETPENTSTDIEIEVEVSPEIEIETTANTSAEDTNN